MNIAQEQTAYAETYAILRQHLPPAELERLMARIAKSVAREEYKLSRRAVAEGLLQAELDAGDGPAHQANGAE